MFRAPAQHGELMVHPLPQHVAQPQHAWRPLRVQHVQVEAEAVLQLGQPEQLFHQHVGIHRARARLDDDADCRIRFVADVAQDRQLAVVHQGRDLGDQLALGHAVRNLGDDDAPAAALLALDPPARADAEGAASGRIGFRDRGGRVDDEAAGREVGALHMRQDRGEVGIAIVHQQDRRVEQLGGVVRRDAGRHADRDAAGAVREQVGEQAGEELGLLLLVVVGRAEVGRVLVQPRHQVDRDGG